MTTLHNKITIVTAVEEPIKRAGIRSILSQAYDIEIIGEAQDWLEVQKMATELQPRIIILDWKMPGLRFAEIEKWTCGSCPKTRVLALTVHDRDADLAKMIEACVSGQITTNILETQLIEAIRRIANEEILFDKFQMVRAKQWRENVSKIVEQLTNRELEILDLLTQGRDNKSIANTLGIGSKTVAYHITNILSKLQVNSRQEAAIWALKHLSDNLDTFPS